MKIGIFGDMHIAPVPGKRIDDYFITGLRKLEEIASNCDVAIHLGDMFTIPKVPKQFENPLIRHLRKLSATYGTRFYSIVGNHDVAHEDESNLEDSSLGTLYAAGVVELILPDNPVVLDGLRFNTVPVKFEKAVEYLRGETYTSSDILLMHHEYETGTKCFTFNDLQKLNCGMVFFGHDHKPLEGGRIIYPKFTVYRSGSTMRNRADEYNFTRSLYYYTITDGVVGCQALNTVPAEKVFQLEAINKLDYQEKKYVETLDTIMDNSSTNMTKLLEMYESSGHEQALFSLKRVLKDQLNVKDKFLEYYQLQYDKIGEEFV